MTSVISHQEPSLVKVSKYRQAIAHEILKMLPETPEPILLTQIFAKLTYARTSSCRFHRR